MSKLKIFVIILFTFFITTINCSAKVKTYTRTEKDYLVPKSTIVDESNKKLILNTPAVDSSEKIYDFAGYFSESQQKKIENKINKFIDKSSMDLVIVTVNDLNGFTTGEFSDYFYRCNDFKTDGIIFVIYEGIKEPEIYMLGFGNAQKIFGEAEVKETLAYVYQNVSDGKCYDAVNDFIKIVDGFYDIEENGGGTYKVDDKGNIIKNIPWIDIIILATTLSFVIVFVFIYLIKGKNKKSCNTINISDKLDNSTLSVKCDIDMPYMSSSTDNK